MNRQRYLFGPVSTTYADEYLRGVRAQRECIVFHNSGALLDLPVDPNDTWRQVVERFPEKWQPDFIVLHLPYATIQPCLWNAPLPIIGLAADANLLWHGYRHSLRKCDLVLADEPTVEKLNADGITHTAVANLFGCPISWMEEDPSDLDRDIDILFAANLHPAIQRERLAWLGRLARLAGRWKVHIATGVFGAKYRQLLFRARIVFNRSIRGEFNQRSAEVVAAGALLFQESSNREVPNYLHDRQECVYYDEDNLEELLDFYLRHEVERKAIILQARQKLEACSFDHLWREGLARIEESWREILERCRRRQGNPNCAQGDRPVDSSDLAMRTWQMLGGTEPADRRLTHDLAQASAAESGCASWHNALGLALARESMCGGRITEREAGQALEYFQRAVRAQPEHLIARLNLVEALVGLGKKEEAIAEARRTLSLTRRCWQAGSKHTDEHPWADDGHFPPVFDLFRVEWERAAFDHAGNKETEIEAKHRLILWRLHTILAQLTREHRHSYEAALLRPDLPTTRSLLGVSLAYEGHFEEAAAHLRAAIDANPFDRGTASSLFHVLTEMKDEDGLRRFARERHLLHEAAPGVVPLEQWMMETPYVGDELASIVIPCCNQVEYTRQCLESVLERTRAPYELILIDNGSTDETPVYFEEVRTRPGPEHVEVVRFEKNLGFPKGSNEGLGRAKGKYLVLLNNDTIVTAGWLEGLIAWSLHEWPKVGLVGPVTNYSRPPQQIPVEYTKTDEMPAFAARRSEQFAHRAQKVDRIAGLCLLMRRDVYERVGGFDERFGIGFFDDDDLSVRAQRLGYHLLLAFNVFVHHFGSKTFSALQVDCPKQLEENFKKFYEKWGPEESKGYRLPFALQAREDATTEKDKGTRGQGDKEKETATSDGDWRFVLEPVNCEMRQRVSLCMIVRNEEHNLSACLESVKGIVDEMIVVDTGSTDRTREIAQELGARVIDFPWVDSFSAARNESIRHATGGWIFWLDADDRVDAENATKLQLLFRTLGTEVAGYCMKCVCLPDPQTNVITVVDHIRLFRNHAEVRWSYRVHEQILPALRKQGGSVRFADIRIQHTGYQDVEHRRRKLQRDLRLLELEKAEQPDDPFTLFNLGSIYNELKQPHVALPLLQRSLDKSHPTDSIVRKLYALCIHCHKALKQPGEALSACRAGLSHYPDDMELQYLHGSLLLDQNEYAGAEAVLLRLLGSKEADHFGSVAAGLQSFRARFLLAVAYQRQGRLGEEETQLQAALADEPRHGPALTALGELLLKQKRWPELQELAGKLQADNITRLEGRVLQGRMLLGRKDYRAARQFLEETVAQYPCSVWPLTILSHAVLQEGRDWPTAEKVLRDIVALDPENQDARHNLAVLLHQLGKAPAA